MTLLSLPYRIGRRIFTTDVTVVAGGQLVQQALSLVTGIMVGRMVGAAGYGLINIVRNIYSPLQILAPLGLDLALLKYVGRGDRDLASTNRIVRRLRIIVLSVNLALALITGLGVGRILMGRVYHYPNFDVMLLITMIALPIASDLAVLGAYYRSRGRPASFALLTLYVQPLVRLALIGLAFFVSPTPEAVITIGTLQVAVSAICVGAHFAKWRKADGAEPGAVASVEQSAEERRMVTVILSDSIWMAVSLFVYGMMRFVDILVLGAYAPARVVGAYAALSTLAQLVSVWPMASSQTLGPKISQHFHAGDMAALRRALNDYIQFASVMAGFLFGGVAGFGDHLDLLFGKSFVFQPAIAFLMPLGYLISATLGPMGYSLSMTGKHRAELVFLIVGAIVLWLACYLLVPRYWDVGAALSVCVAFTIVNVLRFLWVGRTLGFIPGRLWDFAPPIIAAGLAYAARLAMDALLPRTLPTLILGCVVYAAAFAGAAYQFLLTGEGRAKVRSLLGIGAA